MNKQLYLVLVIAMFLAACASKNAEVASEAAMEATAAEGEAAASDDGEVPLREAELGPAGVEDLVHTNNAFAFDLYRTMRSEQFVVSPHGLASVLAMVHAGASGASATQVAATLRFDLDEADVQQKFGQLHQVLRSRATSTNRDSPRGFRLRVNSGVWTANTIQPTAQFLNVANNQHLATIQAFDFTGDSEEALATINAFYADATANKIGEVLESIDPRARILMTNTVQWDAPWALPFERGLTRNAQFATPSGAKTVPMMHGRMRVAYLEGDGYQLVELPYASGAVSMWVLVPDGSHADLDATLTDDFFRWMVENARQRDVDIKLPRFELRSRHELAATLATMGMPDVFDAKKADLSRLAPSDPKAPVYVDEIIQVVTMSVNEDGSDAVAMIRGGVTAAGGELPKFEASRPFTIFVRDNPTGALLAMGRISTP